MGGPRRCCDKSCCCCCDSWCCRCCADGCPMSDIRMADIEELLWLAGWIEGCRSSSSSPNKRNRNVLILRPSNSGNRQSTFEHESTILRKVFYSASEICGLNVGQIQYSGHICSISIFQSGNGYKASSNIN